jgi:hypothetical protein
MNGLHQSNDNLTSLSKDELKAFIAKAAGDTIESIKRVSDGVRAWHECGYDIAELRQDIPFVDVLWKIGCGQVTAELFFHYGHRPQLFNVLSRLPSPLQQKLGDAPHRLPVVGADGEERMLDPREMTPQQVKVVFDAREGRIRTPAEQRSVFEEMRSDPATGAMELSEEIVPGKKGATIVTPSGHVFLTWKQVEFLEKLRQQFKSRQRKGDAA